MDPLQLFLIITGLGIAVGGVLLLMRSMKRDDSTLRPYLPFATIAVGLAIAYRSYSDYRLLDAQDVTIMFLFVFALFSLLGVQFFVVDRHRASADDAGRKVDEE